MCTSSVQDPCEQAKEVWINIRELDKPQWCYARTADQCESSYIRPIDDPDTVKLCKLKANGKCAIGGPTHTCPKPAPTGNDNHDHDHHNDDNDNDDMCRLVNELSTRLGCQVGV